MKFYRLYKNLSHLFVNEKTEKNRIKISHLSQILNPNDLLKMNPL